MAAQINLPPVASRRCCGTVGVATARSRVFDSRKDGGREPPRIGVRCSAAASGGKLVPLGAHVLAGLVVAGKPGKAKVVSGRLSQPDEFDESGGGHLGADCGLHVRLRFGLHDHFEGIEKGFICVRLRQGGRCNSERGQSGCQRKEEQELHD